MLTLDLRRRLSETITTSAATHCEVPLVPHTAIEPAIVFLKSSRAFLPAAVDSSKSLADRPDRLMVALIRADSSVGGVGAGVAEGDGAVDEGLEPKEEEEEEARGGGEVSLVADSEAWADWDREEEEEALEDEVGTGHSHAHTPCGAPEEQFLLALALVLIDNAPEWQPAIFSRVQPGPWCEIGSAMVSHQPSVAAAASQAALLVIKEHPFDTQVPLMTFRGTAVHPPIRQHKTKRMWGVAVRFACFAL